MGIFSSRIRIGEKIGFSFGLVGLLFLGVIWQYHNTLERSLADYQQLLDVFEAKKSHALEIENGILGARRAQLDFILHRRESLAEDVIGHLEQVLATAALLKRVDASGTETSEQIRGLVETYQARFRAIVAAWRKKGLDHNSGLQGDFRDAVHELEAMAANHKVGGLYLQLLQIRRGEKDLGLRREDLYRAKVLRLIQDFEAKTVASELEKAVKARLLDEAVTYRQTFESYARNVLADADIMGGKGPFRQAAHRIEALLNQHYVPDLETNILQLRRREKDYLLRGDKKYVAMALNELESIRRQVDASQVSPQDKARFMMLLGNYQRDFQSLVEQNDHIAELAEEIRTVVSKISLLVRENVDNANLAMSEVAANINAASKQNERVMLAIVAAATLLGIFFAVAITRRIVGPLRDMAELLDKLAYEEPVERVPFVDGGRNELNAMAKSVNTMADHKSRLVAWWKTSMREADACKGMEAALREVGTPTSESARACRESLDEMQTALAAKRELLSKNHRDIGKFNDDILLEAERLMKEKGSIRVPDDIKTVWESANAIHNVLETISSQEDAQ